MAGRGSDAAADVKRAEALRLRTTGKTYRQIAADMGCSPALAYRYVSQALSETREQATERAEELREIELNRIDRAQLALDDKVCEGDPRAIDTMLRLSERRAKLLGLDAPEKHAVSLAQEPTPAEASRLVRERFGGHAMKDDDEAGDTQPGSDGNVPEGTAGA